MKSQSIDLDLRLTPQEVFQRIAAASDEKRVAFFSQSWYHGDKPFLYSIKGEQLVISKRHYYRNDFDTSLYATIEPTTTGSRLRGRFSMSIVPVIFLACWLTFTGGLSLLVIGNALAKVTTGETVEWAIFPNFIPVVMLFGGLALLGFGKLLANSEERETAQWLKDLFADALTERGEYVPQAR